MGETFTREAVVLSVLIGVLLLAAIIILALRTRTLPTCWNCGFQSVRRSHSHRPLDTLAAFAVLCPYRCEKCRKRFYCFGFRHGRRAMAAGRG